MQTIQPVRSHNYTFLPTRVKLSIPAKFINWCQEQEQYRFGWLAAILAIHGCVLAPITVFAVFLGGNSMIFFAMTIGAMAIALISNLAAMPTKITIPVFFLSMLIDIAIIVICLVRYFSF